jgi:hypothetical protein
MIGFIYKYTSPSGKSYIGQTIKIENGVIYSAGIRGSNIGESIAVDVRNLDSVAISFNANWGDTEISRTVQLYGVYHLDEKNVFDNNEMVVIATISTTNPGEKISRIANVSDFNYVVLGCYTNGVPLAHFRDCVLVGLWWHFKLVVPLEISVGELCVPRLVICLCHKVVYPESTIEL